MNSMSVILSCNQNTSTLEIQVNLTSGKTRLQQLIINNFHLKFITLILMILIHSLLYVHLSRLAHQDLKELTLKKSIIELNLSKL